MNMRRWITLFACIAVPSFLLGCQPATTSGGSGGSSSGSDTTESGDAGNDGTDSEGAGGQDPGDGSAEGGADDGNSSDGDSAAEGEDEGEGDDDGEGDSDSEGVDDGEDDGEGEVEGEGDGDDSGEAEGDGDTDDDGDGDDPDDADDLPDEVEDAIDALLQAIEDLAGALTGMADAAGGVSFTPGEGESDCPVISLENGVLSLDYGDGCNPVLYPEETISGSISGTVDTESRQVTLVFNDFTIGGESINGQLEGSYTREDGLITFDAFVDLTFSDGTTITGDMTFTIDESTGEITITTATVDMTYAGVTYSVALTDVHFDVVANGNFLPDSGSATLEVPNEGPGPATLSVEVTFTDQTPVDGTVLVSVEGSEPVPYTPTTG